MITCVATLVFLNIVIPNSPIYSTTLIFTHALDDLAMDLLSPVLHDSIKKLISSGEQPRLHPQFPTTQFSQVVSDMREG